MDKYSWICGIVILAAFQCFLGTSALHCIQCTTGEDCRLVQNKHRLLCPGESNVCVSSVELDTSKGWLYSLNPTIRFSRGCAQMQDPVNRQPVFWASGRKECKYTEEGSNSKTTCWCNTDHCNAHTDFYLPDGRLIRTSSAASLFTTGAVATLLASCAMSLSLLF